MSFNHKDWLVVIPARLASTRLPRKPLQDLGGMPLIARVYLNLSPLKDLGAHIVVATDAEEVAASCRSRGIPVEMTSEAHQSGTDRCAEVAAKFQGNLILNVQGDEPFVSVKDLTSLMHTFAQDQSADLGTLVYACRDAALARDPSVVKAVRATNGRALYFSRSPIPYRRDDAQAGGLPIPFWQHLGIYAFRKQRLLDFVKLPYSALENSEKLEQLRALDHGWQIALAEAMHGARGIDTPHDLEAARAFFV